MASDYNFYDHWDILAHSACLLYSSGTSKLPSNALALADTMMLPVLVVQAIAVSTSTRMSIVLKCVAFGLDIRARLRRWEWPRQRHSTTTQVDGRPTLCTTKDLIDAPMSLVRMFPNERDSQITHFESRTSTLRAATSSTSNLLGRFSAWRSVVHLTPRGKAPS